MSITNSVDRGRSKGSAAAAVGGGGGGGGAASGFTLVRAIPNAETKTGTLYIYESIGQGWFGGLSSEVFAKALDSLGKVKEIDLYVNSDGGDAFTGVSIYNMLVRHPAEIRVHIDGLAASIATLICMAGSTVEIGMGAWMMIHEPWWYGGGVANDLRKMAEMLDKLRGSLVDAYVRKTKMSPQKCSDLVAAETWMDSAQCLELGFVDSIASFGTTSNWGASAAFGGAVPKYDLSKFRNAPASCGKVIRPTAKSVQLRAKYGRLFQVIPEAQQASLQSAANLSEALS
jgi:ATP-dependent protease ClpP protease subunit